MNKNQPAKVKCQVKKINFIIKLYSATHLAIREQESNLGLTNFSARQNVLTYGNLFILFCFSFLQTAQTRLCNYRLPPFCPVHSTMIFYFLISLMLTNIWLSYVSVVALAVFSMPRLDILTFIQNRLSQRHARTLTRFFFWYDFTFIP